MAFHCPSFSCSHSALKVCFFFFFGIFLAVSHMKSAKEKSGTTGNGKCRAPQGRWTVFTKFVWNNTTRDFKVSNLPLEGLMAMSFDTLSRLISRQFWHPGNSCPLSVNKTSCSSLWTQGWLHHRLRSCWKFPKLLFPLCRLCDLHFPGLSVRFVTGYLPLPRMTNLLLWVLVGNTTRECKGGRTWSCGTGHKSGVQMTHTWTPFCVCVTIS